MPGELFPGFAAFILDNLEKGADLVHAAVSHGDDGIHGGDGVGLVLGRGTHQKCHIFPQIPLLWSKMRHFI